MIGGSGKLGGALAARFARAGRHVIIGSRDEERARDAARAVGARAGEGGGLVEGSSNAAAAASGDIAVLTVPFESQEQILPGLAEACRGKVVVSTAVPVRFADGGPEHVVVPQGSAAQQVAELLPGARVVGALHSVSSSTLARLDRSIDADILVTGDDAAAKASTAALLAGLEGARCVDGGPLRNSAYVEQLTVVLLTINLRVHRSTGIRVTNLPE